MAYTEISVITAGTAGTAPTAANSDTVNSGNKFYNDGKTFLQASAAGTVGTVQVEVVNPRPGYAGTSVAIALDGTATLHAGPFPRDVFNVVGGADAGCVRMTYAGAGSAVIDLVPYR